MSNVIPVVDADGQVIVHAGRYARNAVLTAFEMIGGTEAMADWAKENPTDFYTKLFPKVIDREPVVSREVTVEDLLDELDSRMIDVTPVDADD